MVKYPAILPSNSSQQLLLDEVPRFLSFCPCCNYTLEYSYIYIYTWSLDSFPDRGTVSPYVKFQLVICGVTVSSPDCKRLNVQNARKLEMYTRNRLRYRRRYKIEHPRAKDLNMATTTKQVSTVSGGGKFSRERCSLCKERLRGAHSHPEQWKGELQQFLLTFLIPYVLEFVKLMSSALERV